MFIKERSLQKTCSIKCAIIDGKQKSWKKEKSQRREKIMTASAWRKALQSVVNAFIRERDKGRKCISCDKTLRGKYDAGHFYSVGSYPNLRYHEDNIHGQCVHCNQHLHGNLIEYRKSLIERIGEDRVDYLDSIKNQELKITIPEIKEKIELYKKRIKALKV